MHSLSSNETQCNCTRFNVQYDTCFNVLNQFDATPSAECNKHCRALTLSGTGEKQYIKKIANLFGLILKLLITVKN